MELLLGDTVIVQEQKGSEPLRWKKSGIVVEKKEYDQYVIRMDGSGRTTLRNRKFLRRIEPLHPREVSREDKEESDRQNENFRPQYDGKSSVVKSGPMSGASNGFPLLDAAVVTSLLPTFSHSCLISPTH